MSGNVKAAIAETVARAKQSLFDANGKVVGRAEQVRDFVWHVIVPQVTSVQEPNATLVFDWRGKTHVYRKEIADTLMAGADGDAFIDQVLCGSAALMLDAIGGIPDARLRSHVCGRLMGGLVPLTKLGRGKKKTSNDQRDIVISGRLIAPLLDRFNATRNFETKHIESACSIVKEALSQVGLHMSEKRVENIWARFAHLYVPAKYPI